MAGLDADILTRKPISAAAQFRAVAYLRWRLFLNAFRRKTGKGELFARIVGYPFMALILFGLMSAAASTSYLACASGHPSLLVTIFWGIFVLQILLSINISPPGLSFDPQSLIRFPINFPRYLLVRLFLGLLSVSTVAGTFILLAAATGASFGLYLHRMPEDDAGISRLPPFAAWMPLVIFAAALVLALANMLFTRMIFAWVDRWLSTRRAREFFTLFIILGSVGIQYANVTFNGLGKHTTPAEQAAKFAAMLRFYHGLQPFLQHLPPGLAGLAIAHTAHAQPLPAVLLLCGVLAFAALFLAVFGWRMQREYRGENLSEVNHTSAPMPLATPAAVPAALAPLALDTTAHSPLGALLYKEWITIRRNAIQFYGLLLPIGMVVVLRAPLANATHNNGYLLPSAALYCFLSVAALAYNVLGLDAAGVQFYFLSPVPFRTIFLAKNLFTFGVIGTQFALLYLLLCFTSAVPPLIITVATVCWIVMASLVNVTIGNMRSLIAPKKVDPAKPARRQASQLSALLALGIVLVLAAIGAGLMLGGKALGLDWLPIPVLPALAGGALAVYLARLNGLDAMAASHRETLIEELSKTE